ncbi:MAG: PEP-CTERM sorting domain-containing protein, partial [Verrucomicrobiota bacterium]
GNLTTADTFEILSGTIDYSTGNYTVSLNGAAAVGGTFTGSSTYGDFNIQADNPSAANYTTWTFDNIDIAAVPEPSTYALIGIAGGVLLLTKRLRRK